MTTTLLEKAEPGAGAPTPAGALRLGVVAYLNAVPLAHGLQADARFRAERELPARVAERLHADEIDLGMIPSIEYPRGDYAIVPGLAIASRGPVRSVNLFLARPVADLRTVALDTSSRTSAALVRILLRERLGRDPEYVPRPPSVPEMLEATDAALVIGDVALDYGGPAERLDLGAEWTRLTGLPFVWAFWAGPAGRLSGADVERLRQAARAGQAALGEIAEAYAAGDPARRARYEAYLRTNIAYGLGEAELAGLLEFYRRAQRLGLIPRVPELRFHGHS